MTPAQAAARLNRIANSLPRCVTRALVTSSKQGVELAKVYSSGPYSLLQLARLGHPYAKRHVAKAAAMGITRRQLVGSAFMDYMINKQTGRFLATWRTEPPSSAFNGTMRARVVNDAPEAKYLKYGTRFMIQRPIGAKVAHLLQPIAVDNVRQAVREALRTK